VSALLYPVARCEPHSRACSACALPVLQPLLLPNTQHCLPGDGCSASTCMLCCLFSRSVRVGEEIGHMSASCKMSTAPSMQSKQASSRTLPLQAKLGMHAQLSPPTAMRHSVVAHSSNCTDAVQCTMCFVPDFAESPNSVILQGRYLRLTGVHKHPAACG
jgi:hypothetical protein